MRRGDWVMLVSEDGLKIVARHRGRLETIRGYVEASVLDAADYGDVVTTSLGHRLYVLRPTIYDILPRLRHATQVIYPVDAEFIALVSGIGPGSEVAEAGTGSGFLASVLAWRVGPLGRVLTYEVRPDFAEVAWGNIKSLGLEEVVDLAVADVAVAGFGAEGLDAVVLDMGSPWTAMDAALDALKPGGVLVVFSTSVEHAQKSVAAMRSRGLLDINMAEISVRPWKAEPGEMRPETRAVVFTGFIIWGRAPPRRTRPAASP
ncbi:MAG: tRNA (adenine-N1)-methyltransferase [Thermoproteus sp.]